MSWLFTCIFMLTIAFNSYRIAKRQGTWSWPQFGIVVLALIVIPISIVIPIFSSKWFDDKPGWATLLATVLIISSVVALAYCLRKFWPPKKPLP